MTRKHRDHGNGGKRPGRSTAPQSADEHAAPTDVRVIHEGSVITLEQHRASFPDGTSGFLDVVRHPGASAVLPYLSDPAGADPTILLIRQYRHAAGGWLIEVPAGRLNPGELPEACARRELLEETGCTAGRIERLTTILTTPGFSDEEIHLYAASELSQGSTNTDRDEFIRPEPMQMSEALLRIRRGEIRDGKTIITILYAAGYSSQP